MSVFILIKHFVSIHVRQLASTAPRRKKGLAQNKQIIHFPKNLTGKMKNMQIK